MKQKQCTICLKNVPLWSTSLKCCKDCYFRMPENKRMIAKQTTKIPVKSERRKGEDRLYQAKRILYLTEHKYCEANIVGCTWNAIDIHHTRFGADRQKYYLDETTWKSVCRECHRMIHDVLSNEQLLILGLRTK